MKISFISRHLAFIKEKWISFKGKHTDLDTFSNLHATNPSKFCKNKDSYLNQVHCKQEKERDVEEDKTGTIILSGLRNKLKKTSN